MSGEKEIKIDIVKTALAIQLAVIGLLGLDFMGIKIPIIRESTFLIYLMFIPGILVLKILSIKTNLTKALMLSFGTSLSFVTFVSVLENSFLAYLGFKKPISEVPLTLFFSVIILLLIGACKWRNDTLISFSLPSLSPPILSFLLLPFLSIFGAIMLGLSGSNIPLLLLLAIVSIIPLLAVLDKIPEKFYQIVIWTVAASLAFHISLSYVKSLHETAIAGVVKAAGIWDPLFRSTHNSLLSSSILHPVLSTLLEIDIVYELRIISCLRK